MVAYDQLPDGKADGREQQYKGDDVHCEVPQRDCGQLNFACRNRVQFLGFKIIP